MIIYPSFDVVCDRLRAMCCSVFDFDGRSFSFRVAMSGKRVPRLFTTTAAHSEKVSYGSPGSPSKRIGVAESGHQSRRAGTIECCRVSP